MKIRFWSAVTCHRFFRLRPVAAFVNELSAQKRGVKPPRSESGDRSPHSKGLGGLPLARNPEVEG